MLPTPGPGGLGPGAAPPSSLFGNPGEMNAQQAQMAQYMAAIQQQRQYMAAIQQQAVQAQGVGAYPMQPGMPPYPGMPMMMGRMPGMPGKGGMMGAPDGGLSMMGAGGGYKGKGRGKGKWGKGGKGKGKFKGKGKGEEGAEGGEGGEKLAEGEGGEKVTDEDGHVSERPPRAPKEDSPILQAQRSARQRFEKDILDRLQGRWVDEADSATFYEVEGNICSVSSGNGGRVFHNRLTVYGVELCWDARRFWHYLNLEALYKEGDSPEKLEWNPGKDSPPTKQIIWLKAPPAPVPEEAPPSPPEGEEKNGAGEANEGTPLVPADGATPQPEGDNPNTL